MKMPSSSSDLFPTLAVLTALGLNRSLHRPPCHLPPSPTMSPLGPRPERCIYGMFGLSSSPSMYPATPTTRTVQAPPYLRSHPIVAPRGSQWTGLRLATSIHRPSDCSPVTFIPRSTLPRRVKPGLMPRPSPSPLTPHRWRTSNGALPNPPSSLPVLLINPSRSGTSG